MAVLLGVAGAARAAVHFEDFMAPAGLSLVGDTTISGRALRLTPAKHDRSGAAWLREKQPVASGFDTTFQFQLTRQGGLGHGADGFAFVVQNAGPEALGGRGSAGGFAVADSNYHDKETAIPWSVAVFFDTYKNDEEADPSDNYVSVCTYGKPSDSRWPAPRLAFTPNLPIVLKDRNVHTARLVYQPPVLSIFLDDNPTPVLETVVDLSIVVDAEGSAWVGFTASTGGGYENHDILNWSFGRTDVSSSMSMVSSRLTFFPSACLPERKLCTPENAVVDRGETGYHVILPGNLKWGASVPNPSGRTVVVNNAHGIVCWDFKARGARGCSGPLGNDAPGGPGFLQQDVPAGALILTNNRGRTWFSANGIDGDAFGENEGFFEFDVEIR